MRILCLAALAVLTLWLVRTGGLYIQAHAPDFEYFYKGGAWLLNNGALDPGYDLVGGHVARRGTLDWYLPVVPRLMSILAWLPFNVAGFLWLGVNVVALWGTLRLLGRNLSGLPPQDWPVTQLVPFVLLLGYWYWEMRLNQINTLTLLLVVGSFTAWESGRRGIAGFWLGLAVLLKLTPALLVLWFALKRQWRTTLVAGTTVVLAGPAADLAALGPDAAVAAYRGWVQRVLVTGSHRGLIHADIETDWRNQALGALAARWFLPTNYNTRFDNDPRVEQEYGGGPARYLNVATLPRGVVARLVTGVLVGTLVAFVWLTRRPADRLTTWQLRLEWALAVLLMLWFMPVMRRYHMIWALPAISLLAAGIHYAGARHRWSALALGSLALVLAVQVILLPQALVPKGAGPEHALVLWAQTLEAAGAILACVALLAVTVTAMLWWLAANRAALAAPYYTARATRGTPQAASDNFVAPAVTAHA
ncbi:MAG: glycosyltransferase family 87 protein [Planctomycetota bacterium]